MIRFSAGASRDLVDIDIATTATWGESQAELYMAFLNETLERISTNPSLGMPVPEWFDYSVYVAKFSRRRSASGHRIFYRRIEGGIRVIRILHASMNWTDHLSDPE